ncbi:MAG: DeoR/GlpR family DNA-binding transcription regulator [Shinella zoogloeoides]|uniref:DeoR/GlpR family DNA-binding transcription regulator n=1 Tax=Shinella zoogloeoides TaxID=352475 RepID=UPI003C76DBCB
MTGGKRELAALSPEERQAVILEKTNASGRVLAAELAQEFGVSEDSIRRDLRDLSDAGLVQRFHGGAARLVTPALDFQRRETLHMEEKHSIGRAAAAVIPDGATLLVDTSTTVVRFVRALPATLSVRIITAAVDVAAAALDHPNAEVVMLGGRLGRLTRSATGIAAIDAVRALRVDYCVLGTCGVAQDLTLRADDYEDALLKAAMIRAANKTLLLATADKLGQAATYEVAPVSAVSTLFTGTKDTAILDAVREAGVDVEIV